MACHVGSLSRPPFFSDLFFSTTSQPVWFEPTSTAKAMKLLDDSVLPHVRVASPNLFEMRVLAGKILGRDAVSPHDDVDSVMELVLKVFIR